MKSEQEILNLISQLEGTRDKAQKDHLTYMANQNIPLQIRWGNPAFKTIANNCIQQLIILNWILGK